AQGEKMKYLELLSTKGVISAAAGAGALFLLAKTILAGIKSPPYKPQALTLAKLAIEHQSKNVLESKELRGLLCSLDPKLDDYSKNMILHGITRSVYLLEKEASACTYEDIKLVASFLDDPDMGIKIQTLRALKAFTGIWKFRIRVQEFVPKVLQIVTDLWDNDIHVAGLRLLNALQLPDQTHTLLKKVMPALMEILLVTSDGSLNIWMKVRLTFSLKAKSTVLFQKVHSRFLSLFQTSRPGNLLFELLVFVERLCEGRLTLQYQSVPRQYNELSLHEVLFGEESRLADHLLSLIIHPEEEVQIQACRVILKFHQLISLKCNCFKKGKCKM
uniref:Armadillo repeat-containing domain-containing protein n=1 Tax=Salvator merianae TaxID=96440 RepID=A0A8D0E6W7_SALMN